MYVVKVGEYYVMRVTYYEDIDKNIHIGDITLSRELMHSFEKDMANTIASKINGEVAEMYKQETFIDEPINGQLSIFNEEVTNATAKNI